MANELPGMSMLSPEPRAAVAAMISNQAALSALLTEATLIASAPNTVTTGALGVTTRTTFISVTGTVAYTLADGTFQGQRKTLRCTVAAGTPDGTVTPVTCTGFTSLDVDAVNECVELEWHTTSGWHIVKISGATINA